MTTENEMLKNNCIRLGEGLLGKGEIKEAETYFKRAVELSPSCWRGRYGLAQIDLHRITIASVKEINFENLCKAYDLADSKVEVEKFFLNKVQKFAEDTIYYCDFELLVDRVPAKLRNIHGVKEIEEKKKKSSISRFDEEKFGGNARKKVLKELEVAAENNQDLKILYDMLKQDADSTKGVVKSERYWGDSWVIPMLEESNPQRTINTGKDWANRPSPLLYLTAKFHLSRGLEIDEQI